MRIITGKYKGRHFEIPRSFKARPTTDFAKENIFNVLNGYIDFEDATALDLFSGTGSITLELLSRGCSQVAEKTFYRQLYSYPWRRLPFRQIVPSAVRLYLCRPSLRIERAAPDSRPYLREKTAERGWNLCL